VRTGRVGRDVSALGWGRVGGRRIVGGSFARLGGGGGGGGLLLLMLMLSLLLLSLVVVGLLLSLGRRSLMRC